MDGLKVDTVEDMESAVRRALIGVTLPAEVEEIKFDSGESPFGDPVIHVTLTLTSGEFDKDALQRVTDTVYEIRRRVLALDLGRFPHFRFEQAA